MLKISHDGVDVSREQSRYEYLESSLDMTQEIVIGFYKPINSLFVNIRNNTGTRVLSLKYYSGAGYTEVSGLNDMTFGLTKAGFVTWKNTQVGEVKTTFGGEEMYWYKLSISVPATIEFWGISTLFSDDYDLVSVYPTIHNHLPENQETFVRFHAEAAKDIITDLRRTGIVVNGYLTNGKDRKQLDAYDLLDKEEVREAAKYFALSKIFEWLSDAPADKWEVLANKYKAEAAGSLTPLITIDSDDDGLIDSDEAVQPTSVFVGRL